MVKVKATPDPAQTAKPAVELSTVKQKVAARGDAQTVITLAMELAGQYSGAALHEFWWGIARTAEELRLETFKKLSKDEQLDTAFGPNREGLHEVKAAPARAKRAASVSVDEAVQQAIELCDSILDDIDDLPSRADETGFASSVEGKVKSIRETIEEQGRITDKQLEALQRMGAGVRKWLD